MTDVVSMPRYTSSTHEWIPLPFTEWDEYFYHVVKAYRGLSVATISWKTTLRSYTDVTTQQFEALVQSISEDYPTVANEMIKMNNLDNASQISQIIITDGEYDKSKHLVMMFIKQRQQTNVTLLHASQSRVVSPLGALLTVGISGAVYYFNPIWAAVVLPVKIAVDVMLTLRDLSKVAAIKSLQEKNLVIINPGRNLHQNE